MGYTITTPRATGPALRVFTESAPMPISFLTGGYIGTVSSDANIIAKSVEIGNKRRALADAVRGGPSKYAPSADVKGVVGELFVHAALADQAAAGRVTLSALLADAPDSRPDVEVLPPEALADLIEGFSVDIKTTSEAVPGLQDRADNWFMVNEAQLDEYEEQGVRGILFVHVVSKFRAHLAYASVSYIKRNWKLFKKGEGPAKYEPAYCRCLRGVVPGVQ